MTVHGIALAVRGHEENLSRLAYRTALYQRIDHKRFPKTENAIFARASTGSTATGKPRQSLKDQYAMAQLISKVMH